MRKCSTLLSNFIFGSLDEFTNYMHFIFLDALIKLFSKKLKLTIDMCQKNVKKHIVQQPYLRVWTRIQGFKKKIMAFAGGGVDSPAAGNFTNWLNEKLRELNTDESVFGSYITGILEDDETIDEKKEALEGILSEIIDKNIQELIEEILNKWNECHPKEDNSKPKMTVDVDVQLAKLLESQKLQTTVQRQYTAEELRIREQILAQYSQTEVSDEEDPEVTEDKSNSGLQKNTNAHDVMQLQKERREQARLDSQKKKEKDKEDREKQKQLKEEKKEKRKTVKGERRR